MLHFIVTKLRGMLIIPTEKKKIFHDLHTILTANWRGTSQLLEDYPANYSHNIWLSSSYIKSPYSISKASKLTKNLFTDLHHSTLLSSDIHVSIYILLL